MNKKLLSDFYGNNDLEQLRAAVCYLRENPGTQLVIPAGCYQIEEPEAVALQKRVMAGEFGNNPEPYLFTHEMPYCIGLDFSGVEDAEIDARGALFLVHGFMEPVALQHCKNVKLRGLTIDYLQKPYSRGVLVKKGSDYIDVCFVGLPDISEKMPSPRIAVFGRESGLIESVGDSSRKERISTDIIRFYGFHDGTPGDTIYIWHSFHFRPAIHIYEAQHIILEDVIIHSQPGMGIVGHRSSDITMTHLKVVPPCGERMSTNTDATHFSSCRGLLRFDGCQFEGQGDDSTNVHGYYYSVSKIGDCTARLKVDVPTHNCKLDYPSAGDILELCDIDTLVPKETYMVIAAEPDFERWDCTVQLDKPLPANVENFYFMDVSALPQLEFLNCSVRNHLARGVLVKTRGVRIENCSFSYNTGTAIHVAAEAGWHEGTTAKDVIIRNNRIVGSGHQGWGRILNAGGISINVLAKNTDQPLHQNILIEQNLIDCAQSDHAIYAGNINGLVIQNNALNSRDETIICKYCSNVQIEHNR
ncbi:MAG: right-handed parallel beta-helix repeat-containing protein [Candidatus Merdivicinus sp.]|jgi:hypothetical protein